MDIRTIYIKPDTEFSSYLSNWAEQQGIAVSPYDFKAEEHVAEGLLLINENQDIDKESYDLHTLFDKKHLPTQKIDINGTLQVAVSSLDMWLRNFKCKDVLILGSDKLVKNENLDRFFGRIKQA